MAFSKFPELPIELREMIWKAALPSSRVVLLEHKERHFGDDTTAFIPRIDRLGFRSNTRAPAILFVSKEGNKVASRYYRKAFTNRTGTSIPEVYFDFENDFLYLGPEWVGPCQPFIQERILYVLGHELHPADLSRVKNLVIWWDKDEPGGHRILRTYLQAILEHFDNVTKISLVKKVYRGQGYTKKSTEDAELKLLDGSDSGKVDLKVRGKSLPGTSRWFSTNLALASLELQLAIYFAQNDLRSAQNGDAPNIEFNMAVTTEGEEHLLELANHADSIVPWELEWVSENASGCFRRKLAV